MIDVFTWPTPNGHKVHIMLEECGLPYKAIPVNIGAGEQFAARFPGDQPEQQDPRHHRSGRPRRHSRSRCSSRARSWSTWRARPAASCPQDVRGRYEVLQWLMFQMGGVGPMLGQNHHFRQYAPEKLPYAIDRYTNEARRLYGVIDRRLAASPWLGGAEYSIADIATWPWLRNWKNQGIELSELPAPGAMVRRHRGQARGAARRAGAGRPAQAAHRRQDARSAVREDAVREALSAARRLSGAGTRACSRRRLRAAPGAHGPSCGRTPGTPPPCRARW